MSYFGKIQKLLRFDYFCKGHEINSTENRKNFFPFFFSSPFLLLLPVLPGPLGPPPSPLLSPGASYKAIFSSPQTPSSFFTPISSWDSLLLLSSLSSWDSLPPSVSMPARAALSPAATVGRRGARVRGHRWGRRGPIGHHVPTRAQQQPVV